MKVRTILTFTAIVSSILGAIVVYLVLSVPNDLRADALLKQARGEIAAGNHAQARTSLARIIQQYPRTDAAAAATVALVSLGQRERDDTARALSLLRRQNEEQTKLIAELQQRVTAIQNAPPQVVTVTQPAPAPKPAPAKKKTTTRRSSRRRR